MFVERCCSASFPNLEIPKVVKPQTTRASPLHSNPYFPFLSIGALSTACHLLVLHLRLRSSPPARGFISRVPFIPSAFISAPLLSPESFHCGTPYLSPNHIARDSSGTLTKIPFELGLQSPPRTLGWYAGALRHNSTTATSLPDSFALRFSAHLGLNLTVE